MAEIRRLPNAKRKDERRAAVRKLYADVDDEHQHIHVKLHGTEKCMGGDPQCPLPRASRGSLENG